MQRALILLILCYRAGVSVCLPPCCRYSPSCSEYTAEAVRTHGCVRGLWLGLLRVARCHPLGGCGHDPVPHPHSTKTTADRNISHG